MDNLNNGKKSLAVLIAIFYTVIGLVYSIYTQNHGKQEVLSYLPSNESGNFSLFACNLKNLQLNFTSLIITPDPILFDRDNESPMSIFGSYQVKETIDIEQAIEVDVRLQLKTPYGFTDVCELIGKEKCHTGDLIEEMKKYGVVFPLSKGNHPIPKATVQLPTLPFILRGRFEATIDIKRQGKHLGCFGIRFCITECMF